MTYRAAARIAPVMQQPQQQPIAIPTETSPVIGGLETGAPDAAMRPRLSQRLNLSGRWFVLVFTVVFVLELLVAIPTIANHRRGWLADRAAAARVAVLVINASADEAEPPNERIRGLLDALGARAIAYDTLDGPRLLGNVGEGVDPRRIDIGEEGVAASLTRTFRLLVARTSPPVWIDGKTGSPRAAETADHPPVGLGAKGVERLDLLVDEAPLRHSLRALAGELLIAYLAIAAAAGGVISLAVRRDVVRPVQRLAKSIGDFGNDPEGVDRRLIPSRRRDEIGWAEKALAQMQSSLAGELRERRRLAGLGLSVSKINHELRNLLTTAQLLGDRLEGVADPLVQRVAPRLITTLDRAIRFCEATLAYGRATEPYPTRQHVRLGPLLSEMEDLAGLSPDGRLRIEVQVDPDLSAYIDPDQFSRALTNIVRNAVQALDATGLQDEVPLVTISAYREGERVIILLADNGPGLPKNAKSTLFAPFQGSMRAGGTGLGLAIASELIRLNGGTLDLDDGTKGACFRIVVPDRAPDAEGA